VLPAEVLSNRGAFSFLDDAHLRYYLPCFLLAAFELPQTSGHVSAYVEYLLLGTAFLGRIADELSEDQRPLICRWLDYVESVTMDLPEELADTRRIIGCIS
jgi:hypothetical protein